MRDDVIKQVHLLLQHHWCFKDVIWRHVCSAVLCDKGVGRRCVCSCDRGVGGWCVCSAVWCDRGTWEWQVCCAVMHDKGVGGWCVSRLCGVAGPCEVGTCIVLWCLTEVWEEGVCVAATEVWEDEVHVVVTEVLEDDVSVVLCCGQGCGRMECVQCCVVWWVWEYDVVASPSPARGKDANTASNKVAAVCFSAAVYLGSYLQQLLLRCKILSLLWLPANLRSPLAFISLLTLNAGSRYSSSYLNDPLPSYLIRVFSIIHCGTAIKCNCSDKWANSNAKDFMIFHEVQRSHLSKFAHLIVFGIILSWHPQVQWSKTMVGTFDPHRPWTKCGTMVLYFWLVSRIFSVSDSSYNVQICSSRDQPISE